MRAEQKIRLLLTGDPYGEPHFPHEGSNVIRRISIGSAPPVLATFEHDGTETIARCPTCGYPLGTFDARYGPSTFQQVGEIVHQGKYHRH